MRELAAGWRLALLAFTGCVLFLAVAKAGTQASPYAPNEWLFSHELLAQTALRDGRIPFNAQVFTHSSFDETLHTFQQELGLSRSTLYATTTWHFWNGLPLQPSLLAALSLLSGASPDEAATTPLGAFLLIGLTFATADLVLRRRRAAPWHALAPLALPILSAPFVLDLRVLMPSTSLVAVALVLHLLLRWHLLGDRRALWLAMGPMALLPFWYYTVSYYVILLFTVFFALNLVARLRRVALKPLIPLGLGALVPILLVATLLLNGALTSHLALSAQTTPVPILGPDGGTDYASHLNRDLWRSMLLYAGSALMLAPLGWLVLLALRAWWSGRTVERSHGAFAQWSIGVGAFSVLLLGSVGVSFLNRTIIYLTPLALLAALSLFARSARPKVALRVCAAALAALAITTPLFVATASPTYSRGDRDGLEWMDQHERHEAVVYSSLELSSVLFRRYAFHDAIAFRPTQGLLRDFWYGTDTQALVPYLASFDVFVLRHDVQTTGFMEFGPLREPISPAAYAKFAHARDLDLVFDNGQLQVFHVALRPPLDPGKTSVRANT